MVATLERQELAVDETQVSNGAKDAIESGLPYRLEVKLLGTSSLLFHAWNIASIAEKASSAKGSAAKKTDNIESYVYRDQDGHIGIPGQNLASSLAISGKFRQDPRSPRKSAFDLCKAGIVPLSDVAPFEPLTEKWDYEDARRVTVQRAGITRVRPAMRAGWQATFDLLITTPEYLGLPFMADLISQAGRLVGLCDFRPTFGRFSVVSLTAHEA